MINLDIAMIDQVEMLLAVSGKFSEEGGAEWLSHFLLLGLQM